MKTLLSIISVLIAFVELSSSHTISIYYDGYYVPENVRVTVFNGKILGNATEYNKANLCHSNTTICKIYGLVPNLELVPLPASVTDRKTRTYYKIDSNSDDTFKGPHHSLDRKFKYVKNGDRLQVKEVF